MPRFAANLSLLYPELDFLDRFEAAARDGFEAVEFQFPYAWEAADIAARLRAHALQLVLLNAPPGGSDRASACQAASDGLRGIACVPGREQELRAGFEMALDYAQALDCPRVHLMAGVPAQVTDTDHAAHADGLREARRAYLSNLQWAAGRAQALGMSVMIEPINRRDMPGYFLNRQAEAHAIVQEIAAPNLQVQMDLYHCQIVEGDVATRLRQYLPTGRVGHLQIAGVPERHEPDTGELNYAYLFEVVDQVSAACGWQGWVGCEYRPARGAVPGGTSQGLDWLKKLRKAGGAGSGRP